MEYLEGETLANRLPAPVAARRKSRERLAWSVAAILLLLSALTTTGYLRRAPKALEPMRFSMLPPERTEFNQIDGPASLSPDGRRIVFAAQGVDGRSHLWVRDVRQEASWSPEAPGVCPSLPGAGRNGRGATSGLTGVIDVITMTPMVKTQVYLRKEELRALHRAAKRSDRSVADLVREAVRRVWLRPDGGGPVAIWDGEPGRASDAHDTIYDEL